MNRDEVLKSLMEKYPEDLNDDYKCYWWWTGLNDDVTYYLLLRSKWLVVEGTPSASNVLRACSKDPDKLVNLLEVFLLTDNV